MRPCLLLCLAAVCAALAPGARAQDPSLTALHATIAPLRTRFFDDSVTRGATPEFASIKHQLRDWIERQLGGVKSEDDDVRLALQLNDRLKQADLMCEAAGAAGTDRCDHGPRYDWNARGFVDDVRLEQQRYGQILVVRTALGIECGYDDSAYVYERRDDEWYRLFESEQDPTDPDPNRYEPQTLVAVHVSDRLVLTLGHMGWCQSNWYPVYYRLWRVGDDGKPRLLLDGRESAFLGAHEPPILGSVGSADLLVEFNVGSLDSDVHNRPAVRHFAINGDTVQRIDPIALTPRDFVEEWIEQEPSERAMWADPRARASLARWRKPSDDSGYWGEFIGTRRCIKSTDLWQVGIRAHPHEKPTDIYFLVRWRPPYRFKMIDVATRPWHDCSQDDPDADMPQTLFPVQDWR